AKGPRPTAKDPPEDIVFQGIGQSGAIFLIIFYYGRIKSLFASRCSQPPSARWGARGQRLAEQSAQPAGGTGLGG
ncbi:MAG: hypothetical protein WAV08_07645, partial [Desulfobacterales bacterium]